jgi:membrane-bound inhibitor of C-type lysozyme
MTRIARAGLMLLLPLLATACVEPEKAVSGIQPAAVQPAQNRSGDSQPGTATYDCGEDGSITVQNLHGSVLVTGPEGDQVELPASPVAQDTRYGQEGYALVLEGQDALYMKAGKTPLTCRR